MTRYVRCPYCGALLDGALNIDGRTEPRDWEPTVCPHCGGLSVFDFAQLGGLRAPDKADWDDWATNPSLVLNIARAMHLVNLVKSTERIIR